MTDQYTTLEMQLSIGDGDLPDATITIDGLLDADEFLSENKDLMSAVYDAIIKHRVDVK